jgi:acetyltransferase
VELRKDRALGLPPLNDKLARDLIAQTQVGPMLSGYRGRPAIDHHALVGAMLRVSQMACDLPALAELDINPLLADAQGVLALDARVRVRKPLSGEPSRLAVRPYPRQLEERIEIDGQPMLLRPIRPEDGERLAAFYAKTSPGDMRLRFFMARREVPHSELARYCQIDYEREMTFIALAPPDESGVRQMAGEARAVADPDNRKAEFAVQVATRWQGKGLGRALMEKLLHYLRERGLEEVDGQCLRENVGMAALAKKLGFEVGAGPTGDTMSMHLELRE